MTRKRLTGIFAAVSGLTCGLLLVYAISGTNLALRIVAVATVAYCALRFWRRSR